MIRPKLAGFQVTRDSGVLSVYFGALRDGQEPNVIMLTLLTVLKVKRPLLYDLLRLQRISSQQFHEETDLDMTKARNNNFNTEYASAMLDHCIMSDIEYNAAIAAEDLKSTRPSLSRLAQWSSDRKRVIPILCSHLDRFIWPSS